LVYITEQMLDHFDTHFSKEITRINFKKNWFIYNIDIQL
jgi:hypothetical protein